MKKILQSTALGAIMAGAALGGHENTAKDRVTEAHTVFQEIMAANDKGIPQDLLSAAHCVVIVPGLKKGGFVVGAQYGVGVATCRTKSNTGWTAPSTVKMEGGSFGFQAGAGAVDLVLMVMNEGGAKKLMDSRFTIGGEAGAMAGPVGRTSTAETDAAMKAEILSYSRSRGVFAGIAVKGSTLRPDDEQNRELYGKQVSHKEILTGKVAAPSVAAPLLKQLSRYSPRESD